MSNRTRIIFALPALFSGILVGWLVLAGHQIILGPQALFSHMQQITCPGSSSSVQNTGLKL